MGGNGLNRDRHGRKKRKVATREPVENMYYIFCEGEKTEPLYFSEMANVIAHNAIYKNLVNIVVKGTGLNTTGILEYARDFVRKNKIKQGHIWCIFDKDDFPDAKFNSAPQMAKQYTEESPSSVEYHIGWSNQCIEYWFLLHFCYLDANINREDYQKQLSNYFQQNNQLSYAKNLNNLFSLLTQYGTPKKAIRWAEKILSQYEEDTVLKHPSEITPGTTVHILVRELAKYFPDEIKNRYLE